MRSQSRTYHAIVRWLRAAYPHLGSRLAAAGAREIERTHAVTDARGSVFVLTPDGRALRIPNDHE